MTKVILLFLMCSLLGACANQRYLAANQQSLALARQCLATQQDQQQQLLTQQAQFAQALSHLSDTLSHPLKLNATMIRRASDQPNAKPRPLGHVASTPPGTDKQLVGSVENTWFPQLKLTLGARIDTGATTSSIDARHVKPFERDGVDWVRFEVINPQTDQPMTVEHKIKRWVRIRQSSSDKLQRRPVVALQVVIGGVSQAAEFNLTNRDGMDYPVLIGRNVLKDLMIVDVSRDHIAPIQHPDKT